MTTGKTLELEERLHDLICGGLDDDDRSELLLRIVRDEQARRLLADMLALQQDARMALGYDVPVSHSRMRPTVLPPTASQQCRRAPGDAEAP